MSTDINPHELMEKFSKRMRASERELIACEKQAKKLSEKHEALCILRKSLTEQIHEQERTLGALQGQRTDLQGEWSTASFENNTAVQRTIQNQRADIDKSIEESKQDLLGLRERLDGLKDDSRAVAEQVVKLEGLNFGTAWTFATRLRNELVSYEHKLASRRNEARKMLPTVELAMLEDVKDDLVDGYAEDKRAQREVVALARQERQGLTLKR
jgi:seryl-tRNA synthetase